jgi:hypothetical protein
MPSCELELHLERPDRAYAPGDPIRGSLSVSAGEACEAKGVFVRLQWQTEGRGSTRRGPEVELKLFEGSWPAGARERYGFEFTAPAGPETYRGSIVSVKHVLTARVESGWALAGHAETEVAVTAPPPGAPYDRGPAPTEPASLMARQTAESAIASVLIGLLVGLPGVALVLFGAAITVGAIPVEAKAGPIAPGPFAIGFGLVLVTVAGLAVYLFQRWRIARRRLGDPVVAIEGVHARRGGSVRVEVTVTPPGDVELAGASLTLKGAEQASSSENTRTTHEFHRSTGTLAAPSSLRAGEPARLAGQVTIPEDAPLSFDADSNHVAWVLEVTLEPKGWPRWQRDFPIVVWP